MSHHSYEEMILADENLSSEQQLDLQQHIQLCESCSELASAWKVVQYDLENSTMLEPASHFVNRWQARLEMERLAKHHKQNRLMFFITWSAVLVVFGLLVYFTLPVFQEPKAFFLTYLYQLLNWLSVINYIQNFSQTLATGTYGGISVLWFILAAGILTFLGVIWLVSIRYLTSPRRVTR